MVPFEVGQPKHHNIQIYTRTCTHRHVGKNTHTHNILDFVVKKALGIQNREFVCQKETEA